MNEKLYYFYKKSPIFLQNLLTSTYGLYLYQLKYGGGHKKYLKELMKTQHYTQEKLLDLQVQELRKLVKHAYFTVPYYRRLFDKIKLRPQDINNIEDLSKIPILERETVRKNSNLFISRKFKKWQLVRESTSGTTGTPLTIFFNKEAIRKEYAFLRRTEERLGIKPRAKRVIFRGSLIVPIEQSNPPFWRYDVGENAWHFSSYHMSEKNLRYYYDKLRSIQPEMIIGYPSSIYILSNYIVENNLERIYPRAIFTAAETLLSYQRETIEEAFGPNLFDSYGNTEMSVHMFQCKGKNYHIDPEYGIAEVVDKEGNKVPFGKEGELVGTGFCNYAMPLIRYRLSDVVILSNKKCSCGLEFPVVSEIVGRIDDLIMTPEGRYVGRLDPVFKGLQGIKEAQIIQESPRVVIVKVVKGKEYSKKIEERLILNLTKRVGDSISINIEYVEAIPRDKRGKFKAVISKL